MIISKSTGSWGEGADEATLNLEVLGNTPAEVAHLQSLADEPCAVISSFVNGALSVTVTFTRKVSLEDQAARKTAAEAKIAAAAKAARDRDEEAAAEQTEQNQKEVNDAIKERAAQILAAKMSPKG